MGEFLPHINRPFVDLHAEHVLSRYTALDTKESELHMVCLLLRDWCSFGGIPLVAEIPGSWLEHSCCQRAEAGSSGTPHPARV
jgi:hypothetical protein